MSIDRQGQAGRSPAIAILVTLAALMGLAHVLLLPPWEGFDEDCHYSYVRQIADTGTFPTLTDGRVSREIAAYRRVGPWPYASVAPFDRNGGWTYAAFFRAPEAASGYERFVATARPFRAGERHNYEAQHPPLYYALMALVAKAIPAKVGLIDTLLTLRLVSYALALCGLAMAAAANLRAAPEAGLATALWPVMIPGWVPEMARLGNDSLCVVLASLAWLLLLDLHRRPDCPGRLFAAGLVLGLGCLTKAFFLGIAGAVALYLGWRLLAAVGWRRATRGLAAYAVPAVAVGLPWYIGNLAQGAPFLGANDVLFLASHAPATPPDPFSALATWLRSVPTIASSLIWPGTWSLIRRPLWLLLPMAVTLAALTVGWLREAGKDRTWLLPLVVIAPIALGLAYHAWLWASIMGRAGVTPGWYLHILVAPIGFAAGSGLRWLARWAAGRRLMAAAAAYGFGYWLLATGLLALLFAGVATKAADAPTYVFPQRADWPSVVDIFDRLAVLGHPGAAAAAAFAAIGVACVLAHRWPRGAAGHRANVTA